MRNPLYLGSWLLAIGVSILMPPSGAAFFLPAFSIFVLILISAEERFLAAKQGDVYQQYRRRVRRLLPRMAAGKIAQSPRPQWRQAFLAETYPIAITFCFAVFAWRYNARILIQCVLICYGLSLVVRARKSATDGRKGRDCRFGIGVPKAGDAGPEQWITASRETERDRGSVPGGQLQGMG